MSENIKFGHVVYENEPIPIVDEFVRNLLDDKIIAKKCNNCGTVYLPPRVGCNKCFSGTMEDYEIKSDATLTAFTVIHFAPESMADKAPYIAAVGKFEEGVSLLAHLVGVTSMPKVGMKMKLVPQKIGKDRVVFKYVKA